MTVADFYRGKRVLVTGHTGFKGSWLCSILVHDGAKVTGFALNPPTSPNLFERAGLSETMTDIRGDIRDIRVLEAAFSLAEPEIVFHLAAQPIVREGYRTPRDTYETNVMGTVNMLECCKRHASVRSVVNVTTDKVYLNQENGAAFSEEHTLNGLDPYSNSKSCSELVTHCYTNCFLAPAGISVSTARAGNVIGGGDFAADRIIPDCVRAATAGEDISVRHPDSIRPYQHVLEPLMAYLLLAARQWEHPELMGCYNIGPDAEDCITTGELVDLFLAAWGGDLHRVSPQFDEGPREAGLLRLNCDKIKNKLNWRPVWHVAEAIQKTVEFTRVWQSGGTIENEIQREIQAYRAMQTDGGALYALE